MSTQALLVLAGMLALWHAADSLYQRFGSPAWLHPLIIAAPPVFLLAWLAGMEWPEFQQSARPLEFLLAPAVVALALPLASQGRAMLALWRPLLIAMVLGSLVAAATALGLASLAGAPESILLSVAPKSVTNPIALGIIEQTGGIAPLTAAVVLVTGIAGALMGPPIFRLMRIDDPRVIGFTLGLVAHIVGTARAAEYGSKAVAFAGLGMGLTGITTAWLLPPMLGWLFAH